MEVENSFWLTEGRKAVHNEVTREIAQKTREIADEKGIDVLESARRYIELHLKYDKSVAPYNRTASEIISSGAYRGCREKATAILPLLRLNGVHTKYVETLSEDYIKRIESPSEKIKDFVLWLRGRKEGDICGHAFVDVLTKEGWRVFEPQRGFTEDNEYVLSGNKFRVLGKGIDFSEVYVEEGSQVRVYDLTDLARFLEHRKSKRGAKC